MLFPKEISLEITLTIDLLCIIVHVFVLSLKDFTAATLGNFLSSVCKTIFQKLSFYSLKHLKDVSLYSSNRIFMQKNFLFCLTPLSILLINFSKFWETHFHFTNLLDKKFYSYNYFGAKDAKTKKKT